MNIPCSVKPGFVRGNAGELFVIEYCPVERCRGIVFFFPAFAEEMNRSRKMVSLQARLLASHGYRVVIADMRGTGDSHGDFSDSTWEGWLEDMLVVVDDKLIDHALPVFIWAQRLGALLALEVLRRIPVPVERLIVWSPVLSGANFMTQFLRLRLMSALIGKSGDSESLTDIKSQLESGESVEVAGYTLSSALYRAISALNFGNAMAGLELPADWFEMVPGEDGSFPMQPAKTAKALNDSGGRIETAVVVGPKFWTTVETTVSHALAERTLQAMEQS